MLHLINWTGNKLERLHAGEYYLAPVAEVIVRLRVPTGRAVAGVRTLAGGECHWRVEGEELVVRLPRVEGYEGLAVTLRPS